MIRESFIRLSDILTDLSDIEPHAVASGLPVPCDCRYPLGLIDASHGVITADVSLFLELEEELGLFGKIRFMGRLALFNCRRAPY